MSTHPPPLVRWPRPPLRPKLQRPKFKPAPSRYGFYHAASGIGVRILLGAIGVASGPAGWVSIGTATAVHFLLIPSLEVDLEDKVQKEKEFKEADRAWKAALKPVVHEWAYNNADLDRVRDLARSGLFPPLSTLRIAGWFAKDIKRGFDEIEAMMVREKVHHLEVASEITEAAMAAAALSTAGSPLTGIPAAMLLAQKAIKLGDDHDATDKEMALEGKKIAKIAPTSLKGKILKGAAIDKFFRNESAYIIWEFARNGVNLIEMTDGIALLRWGQRTDEDYKKGFKLSDAN